MWKQLFAEAPPGAFECVNPYNRIMHFCARVLRFSWRSGGLVSLLTGWFPIACDRMDRNLLSPRRKALYAFFALAPGTSLGLYLYSVKRQMERDNERLRLEQVNEELQVEHAREQKDAVLMGMVQDMRERIRVLEEQAIAKREADALAKSDSKGKKTAAAVADAPPTGEDTQPTAGESATSFWGQQKSALLSAIKPSDSAGGEEHEPKAAAGPSRPSGINDRVRMRQQEQLKKDVKAFKAAQAAPDS